MNIKLATSMKKDIWEKILLRIQLNKNVQAVVEQIQKPLLDKKNSYNLQHEKILKGTRY